MNVDDDREAAVRYIESSISYPVMLDATDVGRSAYLVTALPTTYLIDRNGIIRERWVGFDGDLSKERGPIEAALRD